MGNPITEINAIGQSIWYDNIRRGLLKSGELRDLIEQGISGVTSNPTIFEKAIDGSTDYDAAIRELVAAHRTVDEIYDTLTMDDIAAGADLLRPVYDRTQAHDGYISIEVPPTLAANTASTITEARRLFHTLGRPNIMIKVPATQEGIPAIRQLIHEGINVNVTLIFSLQSYRQVIEAYLLGLEDRMAENLPVDRIASVASFFVSRVDTLVDRMIKEQKLSSDLAGKAAIANAKLAYKLYLEQFESPRFTRLKEAGAMVQRPLWASTSTKNPDYPDLLYVDALIGPNTVNTLPPQTVNAVLDHAQVARTVDQGFEEAAQQIAALERAGISMTAVTHQLLEEGVASFSDSFVTLYRGLARKRARILEDITPWGLDPLPAVTLAALDTLSHNNAVSRIWSHDVSLWKNEAQHQRIIQTALGWLDVADAVIKDVPRLLGIRRALLQEGYTDVVVLGMGGSSLISDVITHAFPATEGLTLRILDTTHPAAIQELTDALPIETTLFVVASKSGTTTEPNAFYHYFWEVVVNKGLDPAAHFVAITDPGTSMAQEAQKRAFREVFLNPADIGGRYSALSWFGMVPATLSGVDTIALLERAEDMMAACKIEDPRHNPGAYLGAILASLAKSGRNKVTLMIPGAVSQLGDWIEQLLAESTGKEGTGLIPLAHEPLLQAEQYTDDRVFVGYASDEYQDPQMIALWEALERLDHPVIRLPLPDTMALGGEFFRWEFATAVAGSLLGIDAFDQPNVQESKENTKSLLAAWSQKGELPAEPHAFVDGDLRMDAHGITPTEHTLEGLLRGLLEARVPGDFVSLMAYIDPNPEDAELLQDLRLAIGERTQLPTALGFGPRFLHSTGQLFKGGANQGLFIQLVADYGPEIPVPTEPFDFRTLITAQALGDFQSLVSHERRVIRIVVSGKPNDVLRQMAQTVQSMSLK